jgi:hypothetical protein
MPSQAEAHPDDGCLTLEQIGNLIGVTRGRVQQIEATAMTKLRIGHALIARLGRRKALPIIDGLTGKALKYWQRAYQRHIANAPERTT